MKRSLRPESKRIQSKQGPSSNINISKKSKTIMKGGEKFNEVKNENSQKNSIWSISSILSNIFAYIDHKDLVEFNTVCKKWNNVTNPIIHKSIKLIRNLEQINDSVDKIDVEVVDCISNNAKHAQFVKEFKFNYKLNPRRAIEVFETFKFISSLTIEDCDMGHEYNMSEDQFLGIISPLTQLRELVINGLGIENVDKKKLYNEAIQLPPTLKKLKLGYIYLIDNPELFVKTINSHSNLIEFSKNLYTNMEFLEPFYKPYPSLLNFELNDNKLRTAQSLFAIYENNPQLISLKLSFGGWNSELLSNINSHLINLEELKLSENDAKNIDLIVKFSRPTKIKNLNLEWSRLSNCSLDSILLNCPHLEELALYGYNTLPRDNYFKSLNLSNPDKLKKLSIHCDYLSEGVFDSILLKCPHINELSIKLPFEWKEAVKSIYEKCANLQRLDISQSDHIYNDILDSFCREFYQTEFFICHPKCKSTLKQLTLHGFRVDDSKSEFFSNFENLKSIKYPDQEKIIRRRTMVRNEPPNYFEVNEIDMDLWQGYKLLLKDNGVRRDIEFKKIIN